MRVEDYYFIHFSVETMGPSCETAKNFIRDIGTSILLKALHLLTFSN